MEENKYQRLGVRTLIYDIARGIKSPLIFLLITLALVLGNNFFLQTPPDSNVSGILNTIISLGFLATFVASVITILIAWLEYAAFQFCMETDIFKIKRGVFTKSETAIPYRRIESVDIKRTLIHQLFGVSRITIETTIDSQATSDNKGNENDEVFPVIDQILAQNIQEELTRRANVQKMQT